MISRAWRTARVSGRIALLLLLLWRRHRGARHNRDLEHGEANRPHRRRTLSLPLTPFPLELRLLPLPFRFLRCPSTLLCCHLGLTSLLLQPRGFLLPPSLGFLGRTPRRRLRGGYGLLVRCQPPLLLGRLPRFSRPQDA